jgi:transposase
LESFHPRLIRVGATWAPKGQTPVPRHRFGRQRLSLAAALVFESDASDAHLVFQLRPGADNGERLIAFLMDLHHLELGRGIVLLWDGLPAHRNRCMTDWIEDQRAWLSVERLPAFAPELNPTKQVFGNLKSTELANLCRDTIAEVQAIGEVQAIAEDGLDRIGNDAPLCFGFRRHSGSTYD